MTDTHDAIPLVELDARAGRLFDGLRTLPSKMTDDVEMRRRLEIAIESLVRIISAPAKTAGGGTTRNRGGRAGELMTGLH